MHHLKRTTLLLQLLLLVLFSGHAAAQGFSYVYIQGDKETPIYVKLDGQMQPRYGKDYCIISRLAPGPLTIQILFEQNKYPAQTFTFFVPENSSRSFMLTRNGGVFFLYDLQRHFYLVAGNKLADDEKKSKEAAALANSGNMSASPDASPAVQQPDATEQTSFEKPKKRSAERPVVVNEMPADAGTPELGNTSTDGQPGFMNNVTLQNDRDRQSNGSDMIAKPQENDTYTGVVNSDCPNPMSESEFDDIYITMMKQGGDKLNYLLDHMKSCFSTEQVRLLAHNLPNDTDRFTFMKRVYAHVTDQSDFYMLEHLFTTEEGKDNFRHLVNPQ